MNTENINPEVRTMLETLYEILKGRFPDSMTAWDHLMEFLILDHRPLCFIDLNNSIEWLFKDSTLTDELMKVYNSELLRTDYHDHLGEMYKKLISSQQVRELGQYLPSMRDAQNVAEKIIGQTDEKRTVLDPETKTGRRLMAAHKLAPNAILFGVDNDLRLLRIALINCAIHDIPSFLLHADTNKHNINIATDDGKYNWQYANKWHSCMDKLKNNESLQKEANI